MQASPVLRLPAIDILRGVAAGYVVLFHTALVPSPQIELPPVISPFVRFGGTGVLLFFVLSGFSLSMTMGRHLEARQPLLSYARSRFWRIAPVFYVMLIAAAFQTYVIQEETFWPGRMALNGLFLFNLMPGQQEGMVMASWTIGVEVLYYFAFPLLYRCSAGQKIAIIIVSAVAFAFMLQASSMEKMAYFSVVGFIPIFLFGELGFRLFARWRGRPDRARVGMACLLGGFVILLSCMAVPGAEKSVVLRFPIGLGYALLVLGMVLRPAGESGLVMRVCAGLGLISYPLYLVHAPVIVAMGATLQWFRAALPEGVAYVAGASLIMVASISLAILLHWAVEAPGRVWGGRVSWAGMLGRA